MNLCTMLLARAREHPDARAIVQATPDGEASISFADLASRSALAAATLERAGVRRGDRVLLLVPMSIDLYVAIVGIVRLGAVVVLVDPSAGVAHVDRCCHLAKPAAMIASCKAQVLRLLSSGVRAIPRKFALGVRWLPARSWSLMDGVDAEHIPAVVSPEDPALMTFTSGSTGRPKAAVRSHGLLLAQQEALAEALGLKAGDRDLTTLPVFVLGNIAAGVTSIIPDADVRRPGSIDPVPVLNQIERHTPTSVVASPALLMRLVEGCHATGRRMGAFRKVFTGGAPVFWHMLDAMAKAAPNAGIVAVYGSTEAEPIAEVALDRLTPEDRRATECGRGLPAGVPVRQVRLRVIADQWGTPIKPLDPAKFERAVLSKGEVGEIVVTGAHVLRGYLDGWGDEETKFRVGSDIWHRTGDSGFVDEQGRLWLTGRCQAKVRTPRGWLYPLQVEAAAHATFDLRRAAFIASRSGRILIVEPGVAFDRDSERTVIEKLEWAALDKVVVLDQIPVDRRHNAKIDYVALERVVQRM